MRERVCWKRRSFRGGRVKWPGVRMFIAAPCFPCWSCRKRTLDGCCRDDAVHRHGGVVENLPAAVAAASIAASVRLPHLEEPALPNRAVFRVTPFVSGACPFRSFRDAEALSASRRLTHTRHVRRFKSASSSSSPRTHSDRKCPGRAAPPPPANVDTRRGRRLRTRHKREMPPRHRICRISTWRCSPGVYSR